PAIADRSLFMAAGSCLGGLLMTAWFIALDSRSRWIWLAAWICFITAQTANAMAWQKYYEPFCLIMLILGVGRLAQSNAPRPRYAILGPTLLAILLAAVTISSLQ